MIQSCSHCGFINGNADENTLFCPNCGEPYPVMGDLTVQAPRMAPRRDSSPFAPYGTSPYATPYAQENYPGTMPPPPPGMSGARTAALPPRRTRGVGGFVGGMLIGLGLILVIATVVAAAALTRGISPNAVAKTATATPSPNKASPTPTPTMVPLVSYQDPSQRFSVQYPANWATNVQTNSSSDGEIPAYVTTFSTTDTTPQAFEVLVTPQRLTNGSLKNFVQNNGGSQYQQIGSTSSVTFAQTDWHTVKGTFTASNGADMTIQMLYTRRDGITTYAIFLITTQSQFDTVNQKAFKPMLQSFAFGNNPT